MKRSTTGIFASAALWLALFQATDALAAQCPEGKAPADWTSVERAGFSIKLPAASTFSQPPASLDFETGQWDYSDGRAFRYEYGFAVETLAGITDATTCETMIAGRAARYYRFKANDGKFAFGFHVDALRATYPGTGELQDGLTILGFGDDASVQDDGLAVLDSLRFSRIPVAATGVYETPGETAQGLSVHVAGNVAGLMWGTYDPATGAPFWMTGVGDLGDVALLGAAEAEGAEFLAVPVTFYRATSGRFPGKPGPTPQVATWGTGELRIRPGCLSAELAYRNNEGTLEGVVPMNRLTRIEGICSRF